MLTFEKYVRPATTRQAYELLQENRQATVIGGMMWLRLAGPHLAAGDRPLALRARQDRGDRGRVAHRRDGDPRPAREPRALPGVHLRRLHGGRPRRRGARSSATLATGAARSTRAWASRMSSRRCSRSTPRSSSRARGTCPIIPVRRARGEKRHPHARHRAQAPLSRRLRVGPQRPTDFSALNAAAACWQGSWHVTVGARPQEGDADHRRRAHPAARPTSPPPSLTPSASSPRAWTLATTCAGPPCGAAPWPPPSSRRAVERAAAKPRADKEA